MKDVLKITAVALACLLLAIFIRGGCSSPRSDTEVEKTEVKSDTTYIHDTIYIATPTLAGTQQLGYISATLPTYRPPQSGNTHPDEPQPGEMTTADQEVELQRSQPPDSATVEIPIEQRHYLGESYEAWVSGYNPTLDSLLVFRETEMIRTTTEVTRWKTKRWGISIGAGLTATPKGIEPGIFIGASYTFLAF